MCAWGRNLEKKDLIEAGFNIDDINDKITKAATKEDVESIKTSVAGFADSIKALETKLTEGLAARTEGGNRSEGGEGGGNRGSEGSGSGAGGNQGRQNTDPFASIDSLTFMEDPIKHVKAVAQQAVTGVQLHSLNLACEMAYNNAKSTLPHFAMLEEEIKKEWDMFPVAAKGGDPMRLIKNLYDMVKGRHLDEIMTDTNKRDGKFNLVGTGGSGRSQTIEGKVTEKSVELTADEKATAKKWGVTEEAYQKTKEGMKYV